MSSSSTIASPTSDASSSRASAMAVWMARAPDREPSRPTRIPLITARGSEDLDLGLEHVAQERRAPLLRQRRDVLDELGDPGAVVAVEQHGEPAIGDRAHHAPRGAAALPGRDGQLDRDAAVQID